MNLIQDLQDRNLIQDIMPGTAEQLNKEMTSAYIGFDPTADSLHVGSLLPITLLMRLQRAGHKPIALVGGATGMVGDPSGKSAERNLLDEASLAKNVAGIKAQLEKFLNFDPSKANKALMTNNYDWFKEFSFLAYSSFCILGVSTLSINFSIGSFTSCFSKPFIFNPLLSFKFKRRDLTSSKSISAW